MSLSFLKVAISTFQVYQQNHHLQGIINSEDISLYYRDLLDEGSYKIDACTPTFLYKHFPTMAFGTTFQIHVSQW